MKFREAGRNSWAWVKRHKKTLGITLVIAMIVSVGVQLVYPYDRALPFANVAGESVGWQKRPRITLAVQERFATAEVVLRSGDKQTSAQLADLGAVVDADAMATHAVDYPTIFRVVPFSLLWYQPNLDRYRLSFDETRLEESSTNYAKELSIDATNAGIAIQSGELEVTAAKDGQAVDARTVAEALKNASYNWDSTEITVDRSTVTPRVSDASVSDVRQRAETILAQDLTVSVVDQRTFSPDRETIASWIALKSADDGSIQLTSNQTAMQSYIDEIAAATTRQPTKTVVTLVDDEETARDEGAAGLGVDQKELLSQLERSIDSPEQAARVITAERQPIEPPLAYKRNYTNSREGLEAYVKDISNANIQIAVEQLDGKGWSARGNATKSVPSASTYKLYLMLRVFDELNAGDLKWRDQIAGESLRTCFERMIVESANTCAEALIERYGASGMTNYVRERGFSNGSGLTFEKVTQTTAADLSKLLAGIDTNQLIKQRYQKMLLEKMSRQVYRDGIPAGSAGEVYNKVGFLWDYLHDAAIVDHPEGRYSLVIMTRDQSWGKIADITRDIEAIMYGDGVSAS